MNLVHQGVPHDEALRVADELVADVRYGFRMLRESPGFTVMAILSSSLWVFERTRRSSVSLKRCFSKPSRLREPESHRISGGRSRSILGTIQGTDRQLPLIEVRTQTEQIDATLTSAFGVLALILASVGIYGLMSYNVARRTGEIGIRMALGARTRDRSRRRLRPRASRSPCRSHGSASARMISRVPHGGLDR